MPASNGIAKGPAGGWAWPFSVVTGALIAQGFSSLPPAGWIYAGAALAVLAIPFRILRPAGLALLACCWTLYHFQLRLEGRLAPGLANQSVTIDGYVSSLPSGDSDVTRFLFEVEEHDADQGLPAIILVSWYRERPDVSVGEYWRFDLKITPPWGSVNFQGMDRERWLFAQGVGGLGTVRNGRLLAAPENTRQVINRIRETVLVRLSDLVGNERERGVIQALATADRSGLSPADRALLTATGTSHLLAISGLHVGLAAAGGMWLSRLVLLFLPLSRMGGTTVLLAIGGGLLTAFAYSALAGFGVPTLRSVLMLMVALSAILLRRSIHAFRAWLVALAFIIVLDPFAALGAGFWFSFLAVGALLWVFIPRTGKLNGLQTMLLAQAAVVLVLIPVGAAWFGTFSPVSFAANLLAIPWVSIVVVPPVLAGLALLPASDFLAGLLWSAAASAISVLFQILQVFEGIQGQLLQLPSPTPLRTVLALTGVLVCLLPRGLPVRRLGPFLVLPLFLPPGAQDDSITLEVLDTGQGTAAVISSGGNSLLYDSGPGDGAERNLVASVVAPALAGLAGGAPDHVIISHGDLDHAGGLGSLLRRYPGARFSANLGEKPAVAARCTAPGRWSWPGISFRTLHPTPWLPYRGNDSSCVVSIDSNGGRVLLAGDISKTVESRLVEQGIRPHTVLLVPHHGSKTSSSPVFIEALQPEIAIATAGLGNRFDFPKPEVRARYEQAGARFWSTGECGALRIVLKRDGTWRAASARAQRNRVWRWPVARNCP